MRLFSIPLSTNTRLVYSLEVLSLVSKEMGVLTLTKEETIELLRALKRHEESLWGSLGITTEE